MGQMGLMGLMLLILTNCTVVPVRVQTHMPSFDGNVQNSGFIGFNTNGSSIITPHARDRYNALIAVYGARFVPPLVADEGITPTATNTYMIDAGHLVKFATMNRWRREAAK